MNIPCLSRAQCDCTISPFSNLSSEAPDSDRFFAVIHFEDIPPLDGGSWSEVGCNAVFYSTISQQDANNKALAAAQQCTWGGGNGWRTTPTPQAPFGLVRPIFTNSEQQCQVDCPT